MVAFSLVLTTLLGSQTAFAAKPRPAVHASTQASSSDGAQTNNGAAAAKARDIVAAERYAAQAFTAYGRKDYRRALTLYKQALQAAPGANILYNLARIYDLGLHERVHAMQYYRRYLEHPSSAQPRSEYAELRISELTASAPLARHSQPAQTSAKQPIGQVTAPQSNERDLNPPLSKESNQQSNQQLNQQGNQQLTAGNASADNSSLSPGAEASPSLWTTREISAAALGGAGIVSLLVAARFGISAYWENDSWRVDCSGNVCDSQQALDSARRASQEADRATVALAAGAGLLAVASAVIWAPFGEGVKEKKQLVPNIAWNVHVPWGETGLMGSVSGKF